MKTFIEKLHAGWRDRSMLCVGLDPDPDRINMDVIDFCRHIVDETADLVCAFKPQIAYFAALGLEDGLRELIDHIHATTDVPVLLDGKRGDIGASAERYAEEVFERFDADATTVNPYLGFESIEPYLRYQDRGVFILCRNSNPGSEWLQRHPADAPTYLRVAEAAVDWDAGSGNVMLVAGATYPEDLRRIREQCGEMPILVLGVGAQGADLETTLRAGRDSRGLGLIVSSSRAILYADSPRQAALELRAGMLNAA